MFEKFVETVVFIILFIVIGTTIWLMFNYPEYYHNVPIHYMEPLTEKNLNKVA